MPSMKDPSPEAIANVTEHNVETRAQLLPEERSAGPSADPDKQAALRGDLERLWSEHNKASDGTTQVDSEYLEVRATRRAV